MEEQKETKYCEHCGKEINKLATFCPYCGSQVKTVKTEIVKKEVITPIDQKRNQELEKEAAKQLVGIQIIAILGICLWFVLWISAIFNSIDTAINYDPIEGLSMFLILTLLFGGLLFLNLMGILGVVRRKAYAIPICRAVLLMNAGLIFLIMLWPRLNKPLVKWYLNYGSIDIKEVEKEIVK